MLWASRQCGVLPWIPYIEWGQLLWQCVGREGREEGGRGGHHSLCRCKFLLSTVLTSCVNLNASNNGRRSSSAVSWGSENQDLIGTALSMTSLLHHYLWHHCDSCHQYKKIVVIFAVENIQKQEILKLVLYIHAHICM